MSVRDQTEKSGRSIGRSAPRRIQLPIAATSIRRGLAAAHGHELFLTKSENEPCGLIETVCELSVVRIHHLSSFRLRRRSQRPDDLQTRHTRMQLAVEDEGREFFRDDGAISRGLGVFLGELFNDLYDAMVRAAQLSAGQP